mmetsp:Transcript_27801/g.58472  ORF Transcript_27801/g.58472 Transcript_27801/m.58472 type:complete len:83 (-) Transcript_27801:618-866(-)
MEQAASSIEQAASCGESELSSIRAAACCCSKRTGALLPLFNKDCCRIRARFEGQSKCWVNWICEKGTNKCGRTRGAVHLTPP